ncbi:MAG: hypothetical protein M3083_05635 [Actinomycetota bacterium]|nr:hypothetical protein [Actinomycetota bacterium]MDQ6949547.1 hypothetical protein [Actinomycetota bacterium]
MARGGDEHQVDDVLAAVGQGPDDIRAAASAQARSRRRWLRQQEAESSTMAGILLSLAERDAPVTVRCGRWSHRGRLRTVTAALAIVERPDGVALLPTTSITVVEAAIVVADDRAPGAGPALAAVLADLVPDRPRVRLQLGDGTEVAGILIGLGNDVAEVRLTSSVASVRLSAIAGCVLPGRGNSHPAGSPHDGEDVDSVGALASLDDFGSG